MEELIAGLTKSIINDIEYNEEAVTPRSLLLYTNVYYANTLRNIEQSKDSSRLMMTLIALKQMIDALSYTPR